MDPTRLAHPGHPVVQEMLERRADLAAGRDPAGRGTKLAIVVQGGAMRGAISGAALVGLERLGFNEVFDEAWGESAGAINLGYFLARRAEFGSHIYTEEIASLKFLHPLRLSKVLDLDFLFDDVMVHRRELPIDEIRRSRTRLQVSVTRFEDGAPLVFDSSDCEHPLFEVLRASAAAVPLAPRPVLLGGVPHVDGGLANPLPVRRVIEGGATHVLIIPTVGPEARAVPWPRSRQLLVAPFLRGWSDALRRALFSGRSVLYNAALDIAYGRVAATAGVHVAVLPPVADAPRITRMTTRRSVLLPAMAAHAAQVARIWGDGEDPHASATQGGVEAPPSDAHVATPGH